jgi:hypothetical protein
MMLQKLQINPCYAAAHKKHNKKKMRKPEHIAHLQFGENSTEAKLEN